MEQEYKVTLGPPDDAFWDRYAALWQASAERSPFQAPGLLRSFAAHARERVLCLEARHASRTMGAVLLKESGGRLTFLSDLKTDVNWFVFHKDATHALWQAFFDALLDAVKGHGWTLTLNNQPTWAGYRSAFERSGRASGLFWHSIPYSVCPYLEAATPDDLFDRVNGLRELRYRVNRLKNQENAVFEVLTDAEGIDDWVKQFCEAHVARWCDTPTPSHLSPPDARRFLKDCLMAWSGDGLLVRFSIRVDHARIGFVVGLRSGHVLVHHSTTYDPRYSKFSPGKALIHHMAGWMRSNGYSTLDFGDGNEPYKYTVADRDHRLERIFISYRSDWVFRGRVGLISLVRGNPLLYGLYQRRLKPLMGRS